MAAEFKYDAFISYRHLTPDKPIAERLQRLLETYTPPKGLRNGDAPRKLRLFRDETELPTSNDLGGDIKTALEQSRFLIVICSPALEQSKWCLQEIRYFQSLHDNSNRRILTLLVSDPDRPPVFPDLLRFEPRTETLADGTVRETMEEVEPLAANVSAKTLPQSLKKLKTEFLRIAAPLLGCGYDDLYKRDQRRRHRRRLTVSLTATAVLAVATLLSTSALITISSQKARIAKDAEELRRSNAELLLRESKMLESGGDLYGSLEAAAQALEESAGVSAPNGAAAQAAALTGAYEPSVFTAVKKIDFPSAVTDICLLNEGKRLAARTSGSVSLWDTETGECLRSVRAGQNSAAFFRNRVIKKATSSYFAKGYISQITAGEHALYTTYRKEPAEETAVKESAVFVIDGELDRVERLSPESGEAVWSVPVKNASFYVKDLLSDEGLPVATDDTLLVLDPASGETVAALGADEIEKETGERFGFEPYYLQEHLLLFYGREHSLRLAVFRREGTSFRFLYLRELTDLDNLGDFTFMLRDGVLYAAGFAFSGVLNESTAFLQALDAESGALKWSVEAVIHNPENPFVGFVEGSPKNADPAPVVFAAVGDRFFSVNAQTGEPACNVALPGAVKNVYYSENGYLFITNADGQEYYFNVRGLSENKMPILFLNHSFSCEIRNTAYENNVYAVTLGKEMSVALYRIVDNDLRETVFQRTDDEKEPLSKVTLSPDGSLAAATQSKPTEIHLLQTKDGAELHTLPLGEEKVPDVYFLSNDALAVQTYEKLRIVSVATGKTVRELSGEEYDFSNLQAIAGTGELILKSVGDSSSAGKLFLVRADGAPELLFDPTEHVGKDRTVYLQDCLVSPSGMRVLLSVKSYAPKSSVEYWVYDREQQTVTILSADEDLDFSASSPAAWQEDESRVYLLDSNAAWGFQYNTGQQLFRVVPEIAAKGIVVIDGLPCLLNEEGKLIQIRAEGTQFTERKTLTLSDNAISSGLRPLFCRKLADGRLILQNADTAYLLDEQAFDVVSKIDFYCGVCEEQNLIYTQYYDYIYSYPLLSVTQIAERARQFLQ